MFPSLSTNLISRRLIVNAFPRIAVTLTAAFLLWAGPATPPDSFADSPTQTSELIQAIGEVKEVAKGFAFTEGPAADADGGFYFTDIPNTKIHYVNSAGEVSTFTDSSGHSNGLWVNDGDLIACQMDGQVVRYKDCDAAKAAILASEHDGVRFNAPNDLVPDSIGGFYFTDPLFRAPQPLPQKVQAVYYIASNGDVTRVSGDLPAPNGIGLSPNGKKLYVAPSKSSQMFVYDVLESGKLGDKKLFCTVQQANGEANGGSDGITLDVKGNVYFTTKLGVEIVSPEGKSVGLIEFPQHPANVTFVGKDRKTMVVTARTAVYSVRMPIAGLN